MNHRIGDLSPSQRPRERLLTLGPSALSDRELLALVIRNGTATQSAIDLAASVLARFNNLKNLSISRADEIMQMRGIGGAKATGITASFELARRAGLETTVQPVLNSTKDVFNAAQLLVGGSRRERVAVLVCDNMHRLIHAEVVTHGAIDETLFPIREILHLVLLRDGRAFAIAHNHPSGNLQASHEDIKATRQLLRAADAVGLRFLDHVIVAHDAWCSLMDQP